MFRLDGDEVSVNFAIRHCLRDIVRQLGRGGDGGSGSCGGWAGSIGAGGGGGAGDSQAAGGAGGDGLIVIWTVR